MNALFTEAQRQHLRLITGKVLQDRHSPDGVRDDTEQSLIDTEALIQRWHGVMPGLRHHAAVCAHQHACAAARRGRSWRRATPDVDPVACGREPDEIRWAREVPRSRSYLACTTTLA